MNQARPNASITAAHQRMGHDGGPTPDRHPGDFDRPGIVIGRPPLVRTHQTATGWQAKLDDVFGRACVFIVFVMWVIVPICGALALMSK
jgi:hypothetical protein